MEMSLKSNDSTAEEIFGNLDDDWWILLSNSMFKKSSVTLKIPYDKQQLYIG